MPNDDLISRKALQAAFENECVGECGCCKHVKHNPEGCALIDNAPAVDAEPVKHGKWRTVNVPKKWGGSTLRCSECNTGTTNLWNYCPNCGAKMDKEE